MVFVPFLVAVFTGQLHVQDDIVQVFCVVVEENLLIVPLSSFFGPRGQRVLHTLLGDGLDLLGGRVRASLSLVIPAEVEFEHGERNRDVFRFVLTSGAQKVKHMFCAATLLSYFTFFEPFGINLLNNKHKNIAAD